MIFGNLHCPLSGHLFELHSILAAEEDNANKMIHTNRQLPYGRAQMSSEPIKIIIGSGE